MKQPARRENVHPILLMEEQRCRAVERKDFEALNFILCNPLTYVHSTGAVHDREAYLEFLRSKVHFDAVERSALEITHGGSLAIAKGLMRIEGRRANDGHRFASVTFVVQGWTNHGTGWRLSLMQSTRVDDACWESDQTTARSLGTT